jgi:hypothetical protein
VPRDTRRRVPGSLSEALRIAGPRQSVALNALTVDPEVLLGTLSDRGEVTQAGRAGGADVYTWTIRMADDADIADYR